MVLSPFILLISLGLCLGQYDIDPSKGLSRYFDGIGAISGGGATSKLLYDYPEKERDEILDYLFKPNFGASIQMLKVEIGGDVQSSEGSESSHMHESWDENYNRGYEWWLMKEAKKRNHKIKLAGLSWGFPGWVGDAENPYARRNETATYVAKWAWGAWNVHKLQIDYVGIWNERHCDGEYIKELRKALNKYSYRTKIIACDYTDWAGTDSVLKDTSVLDAVKVIGVHYPGSISSEFAKKSQKPIWSVEDYSTHNRGTGSGCLARILNQNYVKGLMTSTIIWNLIASYNGAGFRWTYMGLMTANEPWSRNYEVTNPIWIAAHTTQFTKIGWRYLNHDHGVGMLKKGGSYVTFASPDKRDYTMVIETITHKNSECVRPEVPFYDVTDQEVEFVLKGDMAKIKKLYVWKTDLTNNTVFERIGPIKPQSSKFKLALKPDQVYTLTTLLSGGKGSYEAPPKNKPFPTSFSDDFEDTEIDKEAKYFTPQHGVWEVRRESETKANKVNRQVVINKPIDWCPEKPRITINMGGNFYWKDVDVSIDVLIPSVNGTNGTFIGTRVAQGGCEAGNTTGAFFAVFPEKNMYQIYYNSSVAEILDAGRLYPPMKKDTWYNLAMSVKGNMVSVAINRKPIKTIKFPKFVEKGYVAYGTTNFGGADFDNLRITNAKDK